MRIVAQTPDKCGALFENDTGGFKIAAQFLFPFRDAVPRNGAFPVPADILKLCGAIPGKHKRAVVEVQNPPLRMNMRDGKEQEEQQRTDHFSFLLMASG